MAIPVSVQSIDELLALGDASVVCQFETEKPCVYSVPEPLVDLDEVSGASEELLAQFVRPRLVTPPGRSVTVLQDVYVLPNAAIVTSNGHVIRESCYPYTGIWVEKFFEPWLANVNSQFSARLDDAEFIETPAVYVREHGEMGFFHWMHSVFPRVETFINPGLSGDFALLCKSEASYQTEALALAGLQDAKRIEPNSTRPQFFKHLIFPSALVRDGDFWLRPPSVGEFYSRLPIVAASGSRRMYLTRQDASVRRVANECDLTDRLAALGFMTVELGKYTFSEQLSLFRECEIVIAPHGAGLSHIIGMPKGATVIEILHPRRFWPTYRAIAARRDLKYGFCVGQDNNQEDNDMFDFQINVEQVVKLLRGL